MSRRKVLCLENENISNKEKILYKILNKHLNFIENLSVIIHEYNMTMYEFFQKRVDISKKPSSESIWNQMIPLVNEDFDQKLLKYNTIKKNGFFTDGKKRIYNVHDFVEDDLQVVEGEVKQVTNNYWEIRVPHFLPITLAYLKITISKTQKLLDIENVIEKIDLSMNGRGLIFDEIDWHNIKVMLYFYGLKYIVNTDSKNSVIYSIPLPFDIYLIQKGLYRLSFTSICHNLTLKDVEVKSVKIHYETVSITSNTRFLADNIPDDIEYFTRFNTIFVDNVVNNISAIEFFCDTQLIYFCIIDKDEKIIKDNIVQQIKLSVGKNFYKANETEDIVCKHTIQEFCGYYFLNLAGTQPIQCIGRTLNPDIHHAKLKILLKSKIDNLRAKFYFLDANIMNIKQGMCTKRNSFGL